MKIDLLSCKEKAYLIGIILGDGYLYHDKWRHYKVNIYLNSKKDEDIAKIVTCLLNKMDIHPYRMYHHGCLIIRFNSKSFYQYIKKEISQISKNKNSEFYLGIISGLIDSDGYVCKGDIVISNVNKELIDMVRGFCCELDIKSKIWKQKNSYNGKTFYIWRIRISTRFKYEKHYSQKVIRVYGGALPIIASIHSEMDDTYKGGVARKSRRAHNP